MDYLQSSVHRTELVQLARQIDFAKGEFALYLVQVNSPIRRDQLIVDLKGLLAERGITAVEVVCDKSTRNLLTHIQQALEVLEPAPPVCILVKGLEHSITQDDPSSPLLSHLNLARALYRTQVPYPLVLWMPEYTLTSLARIAPDFWAWRSGVFEFEPVRDITQMAAHLKPFTQPIHTLPFDKLSPRDFERLCLWLVEREGYERAEHLGAAGGEQGRDIVAWREGAQWVFQCRRVQRFGPKDALTEVEKVLALPEAERPVGLVFLVTCDVSTNTREQVRARCAGEMECHFWAGAELDEKVKRHADIVEEFFQIAYSLADQLPKPKDLPIPHNELFLKVDPVPHFTCRQSVNIGFPQASEEVQVYLRLTNESQIEARDVHVNVQLPPGYDRVDPHGDLKHHESFVGPYEHFSLILVMRAIVENADPTVNLTLAYLYGEDNRSQEQYLQAVPIREGESLWDLVNQDQITAHLEGWLKALRPGQPLFVRLDGELGVGKTRILQHTVQAARQMGYHVFHTTCPRSIDLDRPDPLPPMLESGLRQLAPDAKLDQIVRGIADHSDYTPMVVVVTAYLGHPIPGTSKFWDLSDQAYRDSWIARFIVGFSKHKPSFIVVDDLDYAPTSTLRLLRCIADEAEIDSQRSVRILVTFNPKARHLSDGLLEELEAITDPNGHWIVLCLKADDTQELIEQVYNRLPPPGWAEELHKLCQGNPLLVLEVLRLLERKGKLTLCQGRWEFADEPLKLLLNQMLQHGEEITIDAVLKARLPDPHEDSYRFLQVMAVLGPELEFDDIARFVFQHTGLSKDAFAQAKEQLRHLGVLTESADGLWTITPPILYEAVMDSLSASKFRLRRLHGSAAEYLKDKYKGQGEWAAEIAYHFYQADQFNEAFEYLLRAAEWEKSRKDFWRTVQLYEWALENWPKEHPLEKEGELRLSLSNLYETLGDYELAQKHLDQAYSVFERARDALGRVKVRIQQGWIAHLRQSDHQAVELYELAQDELDSLSKPDPQLQRKLWHYYGLSAILTGQLEKGYQLIMRALDAAQEEADENELANIHLSAGLSYFKREMWEDALKQYDLGEKVLRHFENIEDFKVKAKLVASKATVHLRQHRDEQACAEYEEAIMLARELPYPDVEAEASYGLGVLYQEQGDLDQAIRYLTYSARTYDRLRKPEAIKNAYEELLRTLYIAERWDELLYEAAYANRSHALSSLGLTYALSALSSLGRSPAEYPDLFDNVPNEPPDPPERRIIG